MNPEKRRYLSPALGLLLCLAGGQAAALSSDSKQAVDIAADSVDINEAKGVSTYSGNVELNQGSIRLRADKVVVEHKPGKPRWVRATGKPAEFRQLPDGSKQYVNGLAQRIEYSLDSDELFLIDKARLTQGKDVFSSDRIVYDRDKSVVKAGSAAQGKQRVKVTIQPGK